MKKYYKERDAVATFMRRLYDRQLTTASGGNISLRVSDDEFCITPSSLDKGNLTAELIAIVKFDGTNLTPDLKLSIETEIHTTCFTCCRSCTSYFCECIFYSATMRA